MDSDDTENKKDWHSIPIKEVIEKLQTSYNGLTEIEAQKRFEKTGPNILKFKERKSYFFRYMNSLHGRLSLILLISILVSKILENQ